MSMNSRHLPDAKPVVVLVTRCVEDRVYLLDVVARHELEAVTADSCRSALHAVNDKGATAVFCDESLPWKDLLSYFAQSNSPPRMVVVASTSSGCLVAEVAELGGFDVVLKPFDRISVDHVLRCATEPSRPFVFCP